MFTFARKRTHSRRPSAADLCISAVQAGSDKRWQISFRVSTDTMQRLRLLPNDKVVATCDPKSNRYTLTRVHDESGNQISTRQSKTTNYGQVRFSCDKADLEKLGLLKGDDNSSRIEASFVAEDGPTAVFAVTK